MRYIILGLALLFYAYAYADRIVEHTDDQGNHKYTEILKEVVTSTDVSIDNQIAELTTVRDEFQAKVNNVQAKIDQLNTDKTALQVPDEVIIDPPDVVAEVEVP